MDFEKLYNAYYMQVYSFAVTLMRNSHIAEEITQEVFFRALKNKQSYRAESSELTWLCAITKNLCTDYMRRESKRSAAPPEDSADEHRFEQALEDESTTFAVHTILHQMEEPYKEVFQLRIFGELSFVKIGRIFGKTENWARVTYHRAKLKIQEKMEEEKDGTEI